MINQLNTIYYLTPQREIDMIAEIHKSTHSIIRIEHREYKGRPFIDIRQYYLDGETDTWKPTAKGVTCPPELLPELIAALEKLNDEAAVTV